jgi:hypothetical protein
VWPWPAPRSKTFMTFHGCEARRESCGSPASVPLRNADCLQKPSAGLEAADVRDDLSHQLAHGRPPRHVRHDRPFGVKPERALRRQRLWPKRVQGGLRQLARIECGDRILAHYMLAAPDVHQHGSSRHQGKRARAEDALGFPRQW